MASRRPKTNSVVAPVPTDWIQTCSKNVITHPGRVVNEVLAVQHRPEEIEVEKAGQTEHRQAQEQKEADLHTAALEVTEYENKMAVEDTEKAAKLPQCKPESELSQTMTFDHYKN